MARVAFVVHQSRALARELAASLVEWLESSGHDVVLAAADAKRLDRPDLAAADGLPADLDLAVSIGGDGTMLHAVDQVARAGVPVLGVNVGHLGYLTAVEPVAARPSLERVLAGDFTVEERMMLAVEVRSASGELPAGPYTALNEVVLEKTPMGHTVRLSVDVDGERFTTYAADGLIVATPTGSTAYSFSARGPIVAPTHAALVLTPVSPHMLFDRSLVLEPHTELVLGVLDERQATVSVDGRNLGTLLPGDSIVCTSAGHAARLVTFRHREFLSILKSKFGLEDR